MGGEIYQNIENLSKYASFSSFYGKVGVGFCLNIGKHFVVEVSF